MADKMATPKYQIEGVGIQDMDIDLAKLNLKECIRTLLGDFERMTAHLVHYADFCSELQNLTDIERKERDINMIEVMSHLLCLDLLTDSWSMYFEDLLTKYENLLDIGKAKRGTKMVDFLIRLRCLELLTNCLSGYFDDEDLGRIKFLSSLSEKNKTKP